MTCLPPWKGQAALTQSVEGGHQANIHPVFRVCRCQSEPEDPGRVLLRKLEAQPGDWVLPPGLQQCLHVLDDLCTASPLVLIALEAVEEDDKFTVTAPSQSCAPARGASLGRKQNNSESCILQMWYPLRLAGDLSEASGQGGDCGHTQECGPKAARSEFSRKASINQDYPSRDIPLTQLGSPPIPVVSRQSLTGRAASVRGAGTAQRNMTD